MTAYADVEKANSLIAEQTRIASAIDLLDNGGTISNFTVVPPPPPPLPEPPPITSDPTPSQPIFIPLNPPPSPPPTPVSIQTIDPSPELLASVRTAMVDRYNAINGELEALGVVGAPPTTV
jgi:hypothetical protein